jgi:hypothetical protein
VLTELSTGSGEIPDAVGWWGIASYLVECKASLEDFKADAKKSRSRAPWLGVGMYRYYLVPEGLIDRQQIPHDWGLLYAIRRSSVRVVAEATPQMENAYAAVDALLSTLRRLSYQRDGHVSTKFYRFPTQNKATISIIQAAGGGA